METKEFMISDIIFYKGYNYPLHISQINDGFIFIEESFGNGKVWKQEAMMDGFNIEPIPLTEEILIKNEFTLHKSDGKFHDIYTHPVMDYRHRLEKCPNGGFYWQTNGSLICHIKYVHQLQHALRICGLNDFADNLKI